MDQSLHLTQARREQLGRGERGRFELDHEALDFVLKLAHVPGPIVCDHELHRLLREAANGLADLRGVPAEKVSGQEGDVLAPLAERWQSYRKDLEAIVEILPEPPLRYLFLEVSIGGSNDANVHMF